MPPDGPAPAALDTPRTDDARLVALLGAKGYTDDVPLVQYAAWADRAGLFEFLAGRGRATLDEVVAETPLTEPGADAIVGVLASLGLVRRDGESLALAPLAGEYLVRGSPFYMGHAMYVSCRQPLPAPFVTADSGLAPAQRNPLARRWLGLLKRLRGWEFGGRRILENQHCRNLPAATAAAHLPLFDGARCVVDMAGGSGTFSIPLARRLPAARIVLTDLPQAIGGARRFLRRHGVLEQVELVGMDAFAAEWPIPACDVMFFGNFVHGFDDERCRTLARNSLAGLHPGGAVVWHELVWNENRDGPLKTALFNTTMRLFGGRQRTIAELHGLLGEAGFEDLFAWPTSGGFYAVGGRRPGAAPGTG